MASIRQAPERSIVKVALAALVGSSIEWYDFFIYGTAAALVFPELFFPGFGETGARILAYSTFAMGFVGRAIGGVVFGHFGDLLGRKRALVVSLMLMGVATVAIGLLPGYATIGILAPVLLVTLRFAQGLAIGGQWGGVVLLATESSPAGKRGFYGGFAQLGVPVGVLLSNLLFLALTVGLAPEAFQNWGWRVPFLLSVLLIGVGLYIQFRLEDTPEFRHLKEYRETQRSGEERSVAASPVIEVLKNYPKQVALAAGAFVAINANFYVLSTYVIDYGTSVLDLSRPTVLTAVLIASLAAFPAILGFAALSDVIGRRKTYMAGAVLLGLWAFALWPLVDTGSAVALVLALVLAQVFLSAMYGPQAAFFSEMFSTRVRYSGASLGYQLGAILGGALAPTIATLLYAEFETSFAIAVYMAVVCAITFFSVYLLTETYQSTVDDAESRRPVSQTESGS